LKIQTIIYHPVEAFDDITPAARGIYPSIVKKLYRNYDRVVKFTIPLIIKDANTTKEYAYGI